ncbi:uncharacterized protein LOC108103941 isoform X3 [Drosophila eugracilis]|uniref:uncharacterized protein LOC108103941 isoform X3 n=1 Tax=Drosophila eugracilis TaxID=29029 RepID=UPI0007E64613|nr:uncharacterized protein LOC108103941 isoform X3 [Drosophila eugracilis]
MSRVSGNHLYDEPEVMEEFISCYRHFTALWDSSSANYLSKQKKEPGYQELLKILRRVNGGCSVQDVKRKINSLRCCYRREIKKVQSSANGYQPRLWWFPLMDFLKPVLNIQSPVRVKSESMDDSLDETSMQEEDMSEHEEDVLRLATVVDNEPEPEPEVETTEPDQEIEQKVFVYESMAMAGNNNIITNNSYANQSSFSHIQHDSPASITTDTSNNRRNRIRRRRSTNETDYVEDAKARRTDLMIPDASRARDRERDRDRENDSENECELIGRRMASHFRHMRQDQRLYAERIISEVLVYGRMNRLSFESRFIPEG